MTANVTIHTIKANTTKHSDGLWVITSPMTKCVVSNIVKLTNDKYRTTHDMLEHETFESSIASLLPLFKKKSTASQLKLTVKAVTAALMLSPMMVAQAQDLSQAQEHFSHADRFSDSITMENIKDNIRSQGSTNGVNNVAQNMSNERVQAHTDLKSAQEAQTLADIKAEQATAAAAATQAAKDAADNAQVMRENQAHSSSLKNMHTTQDHLDVGAPGITKESNPAGHPTGQLSPMDPKGWTMQPAITKETNPLGHPTGQQPTVGGYTQVQSASTHISTGVTPSLSAQGALQSGAQQTSSISTAQVQSGKVANSTTPVSVSTAQAQPQMAGSITQTQVNVPQQRASSAAADISVSGAQQTTSMTTTQAQSGKVASGTTPVSISTVQNQPAQTQSMQTTGTVSSVQNIAAAKPGTVTAVANIDASKISTSTNSTINVSVTSMQASQPVTATVNGVSITTTAGELAKVQPLSQVSVPMSSVFVGVVRNGNNHDRNSSHGEHGTGNGANNAANSNSAHGLGGGNHIGGGSAQSGSRNVGHW